MRQKKVRTAVSVCSQRFGRQSRNHAVLVVMNTVAGSIKLAKRLAKMGHSAMATMVGSEHDKYKTGQYWQGSIARRG